MYGADTTMRDRTFDRLKRSIANEPADGHGVFLYYTFPFFQNVTGVNLQEYYHKPEVMFQGRGENLLF